VIHIGKAPRATIRWKLLLWAHVKLGLKIKWRYTTQFRAKETLEKDSDI
jgi:hypothetical protein